MDMPFLERVCDSYLTDRKVHINYDFDAAQQNLIKDKIVTELQTFIKELRNNDLELYDTVYNYPRLRQTKIIYTYLDKLYESDDNQEILTEEPLLFALGGVLAAGVSVIIFGKPLARSLFSAVAEAGKIFEKLGEQLIKYGRFGKFRYAILQSNSESCYKLCGIQNPKKEIDAVTYLNVQQKFPLSTSTGVKQVTCLRECYITSIITIIKTYCELYFKCLKATGGMSNELNKLRAANSNDIMIVLSKINIFGSCQEYYKDVKQALDNFDTLLDYLFPDKEGERENRLDMLRNELFQIKQKTF